MPTRLVREGFLDSDAIHRAGEAAEVMFLRLILVADDYGRFDGRLSVIRSRCWPLGLPVDNPVDNFEAEVEKRLQRLESVGLIHRYEVDGKPFLEIPNFRQRTRAVASKYPENKGNVSDARQMPVKCQSNDGPPRAYSDSDSNANAKAERTHAWKRPDPQTPQGNGSANPKLPAGWWSSDQGILQAANTLGLESRRGESFGDLKARINAKLEATQGH